MSEAGLRELTTARMTGVALTSAHAGELGPLLNDPRVAAMLAPNGRAPARGATPQDLAVNARHWREHGFGLWLLRDRETELMVGRGGLQHTLATGVDEVEIGWAIVPERWNQGLATELALACVEISFEQLGLESVIAYTRPDNVASRRVMEKAGMAFERMFRDHHRLDAVLYRRRRC